MPSPILCSVQSLLRSHAVEVVHAEDAIVDIATSVEVAVADA
jgi:hypothetical protein